MEWGKNSKIGARLAELRKRGGLSQSGLARQLAEWIGRQSDGGKGLVLDGVNGKQTVSQLERGARGITIDIAFAYAHVFDVSLDYVLCRTDCWKWEYKDTKMLTGLSDSAIKTILSLEKREKAALNAFLEQEESRKVFNKMAFYQYQSKNREVRRKQEDEWRGIVEKLPQYSQGAEEERDWGKTDRVDFAKYECSQAFQFVLDNLSE